MRTAATLVAPAFARFVGDAAAARASANGSRASRFRICAARPTPSTSAIPRTCGHSSTTSCCRASSGLSLPKGNPDEYQSRHDRSRRDQRPRSDPVGHEHGRRRRHARGARRPRRDLHVGLRAQPAGARQALREGEDVAVERHDRPRLVDPRRPGAGGAQRHGARRRASSSATPSTSRARRSRSGPRRNGSARDRGSELDALAVHARRAGCADLYRAHRRDRAVDRRQVLRGDAGDGRGAPRRGVRQVPRREAQRSLPDQRAPALAARRHPRRQPLGHDLPRHADHGRGTRARRVRLHAPDDDRAACSSSCSAT